MGGRVRVQAACDSGEPLHGSASREWELSPGGPPEDLVPPGEEMGEWMRSVDEESQAHGLRSS